MRGSRRGDWKLMEFFGQPFKQYAVYDLQANTVTTCNSSGVIVLSIDISIYYILLQYLPHPYWLSHCNPFLSDKI